MQVTLEKAATGLRPSSRFVVIAVDVSIRNEQPNNMVINSKNIEIYHYALIRMVDLKEFHFEARYSEFIQWYNKLKNNQIINDNKISIPFPPKLVFQNGFRSIIGRSNSGTNPLISSPPTIQTHKSLLNGDDINDFLREDSLVSSVFSSEYEGDEEGTSLEKMNNIVELPSLPTLVKNRQQDLRNWLDALFYSYPSLLKHEIANKFLSEKKCPSPMELETLCHSNDLKINQIKTELFKTNVKNALIKNNEEYFRRNEQGLIGTEDLVYLTLEDDHQSSNGGFLDPSSPVRTFTDKNDASKKNDVVVTTVDDVATIETLSDALPSVNTVGTQDTNTNNNKVADSGVNESSKFHPPLLEEKVPSLLQCFIASEDAKWFEEKALITRRRTSSSSSKYSQLSTNNSWNSSFNQSSSRSIHESNSTDNNQVDKVSSQDDGFYSMNGSFSMKHASSLAAMPSFKQDMEAFLIRFSDLDLEDTPFAAGAGGKVFRGSYGGTPIAAKMLYSQYISNEREEFDREFKTLATLHHPNIMTFFGMSRDAENAILYHVCEYCGGGTLQSFMMNYKDKFKPGSEAEKLSKESPLSMIFTPKKYNEVVIGLLEGVRYMHANGFAHRDLKPNNVLMTIDGRIKLCDMGIVVRAAQGRGRLTKRSSQQENSTDELETCVGTLPFMPPEAFDDLRGVSPMKKEVENHYMAKSHEPLDPPPPSSHFLHGSYDHQNQSYHPPPPHPLLHMKKDHKKDKDLPYDPRSWDVYSLGIILWQLWHRMEEPYDGLKSHNLIRKVRKGLRPPSYYIKHSFSNAPTTCSSPLSAPTPIANHSTTTTTQNNNGTTSASVSSCRSPNNAGRSVKPVTGGGVGSESGANTPTGATTPRRYQSKSPRRLAEELKTPILKPAQPPDSLVELYTSMWQHDYKERPKLDAIISEYKSNVGVIFKLNSGVSCSTWEDFDEVYKDEQNEPPKTIKEEEITVSNQTANESVEVVETSVDAENGATSTETVTKEHAPHRHVLL